MAGQRRDFAQPQWLGEPGAGRTLLVHAEQGYGDSLQFCRYVPMAAEHGLRVILEVPRPLVRLLRCLPGIDRVMARGETLPRFDLHCPMLSLPLALQSEAAGLPDAVPYLSAEAALAAAWRTRLAAVAGQGRRVGLVWAGNAHQHPPAAAAVDRRRSIAPQRLAPLFAVPGLHFISLQKAGPTPPAAFPLLDWMSEVDDFADTAALVANLDLVISVDTATAHLAAAMGKPVWLLDRFDPCWRWQTGRSDSPWYPALRLFRQPNPGDWDTVIAAVQAELRRFADDRTAAAADPPPRSGEADIPALFEDAVRQHQAGRLAGAQHGYRRVLALAPHHADALHLLGVASGQGGRHDLAAEMIGAAIALNPADASYHANLAISLRQLGRPDAAIASLRSVLALRPDDPEAHNQLGIALREQRHLDAAVACYRRAIELRPAMAQAYFNLGNALGEQGRLDDAAGSYRSALERQPGYPEALNNLGNVLRQQGALQEAIACYRKAIGLRPGYPDAAGNLRHALQEQERRGDT